jgi:HAMP domain-containing protein
MEKELYQPIQLYQSLDELIQENLDLTIKLHVANREVGKLKLEVNRLVTEFSTLHVSHSPHSK